ncbi:GNAT family N-acetyltransferase [Streptomyces sp. NPDC058374]|uniref:GNAT family N-acetyltransferase n=1 Tax=Streptomyces sp. NPDC058374 TaxID=3346466 RepID=UPI0036469408
MAPCETVEPQVRPGVEEDLAGLTDLYNHFILRTPITFDTVALTPKERMQWFLSHPKDGPHRLMVATESSLPGPEGPERLLGYATSSPLRPKAAYSTSVEVTVYCAPDAGGRGVGSALYRALFEALAGEDLHRAYAAITQPNEASHRLHTRFGFRPLGTYEEVGRKFGRYWDVRWYQKELDGPPGREAPGSGREADTT